MTPQQARRGPRTAVLGLLLLLPLGGCAGGVGAAAPVPSAVPAATPLAAAPRPSARPTAAAPLPAVPTVRATLKPAAPAGPAPARFTADDVRMDLPVKPFGVDDRGFMRLPETVHEVAWYEFSARPGDRSGTTVLAAHVDTVAEGLGPFANLRDLHEDDEVRVEDARGRVHRYVVTSVAKVDKGEVPIDRVFRRDGDPTLVVLTCGGSFSPRKGYSANVIVTARPLD